ncbi:MAG: dTDP-4-dehydrorhamnose 3,5-epimerase family protein [Candidatus Eisenbacteria bacterium]|nr:dTDP-4-dehydrorhamnose 3,5-epimerase family protein [Candidatus Eisenbacteria bacterium]
MIDGVKTKKLKLIPDERGYLMEMLRSDDEIFRGFGQVYLTVAYDGVVKGWHYHKKQTDYFVVVRGMMKVVLYDQRENSPTRGEVNEFVMGELNPMLLVIPPEIVHGMKAVGGQAGYLINCPDQVYNHESPDEYRIDPHEGGIPYDWARKDG